MTASFALALALLLREAAPAGPPAHDPAARAVIEEAARIQAPDGPPGEIEDFQADLVVSLFERDPEGGPDTVLTGHVTQFWLRQGSRTLYRRTLREQNGKTVTLGWNGRLPWMQAGATAAVDLNGRGYERDRQTLEAERLRTDELVPLFFVSNHLQADATWSFGRRDGEISLERGPVAVEELVRRAPGRPTLSFLVGRQDRRLYGVDVPAAADGAHGSLRFLFDFHEILERSGRDGTSARFLVPTRVEGFEDGRRVVSASARQAADIKFNTGLSPRVFVPPR
jgi:hypothetical protein